MKRLIVAAVSLCLGLGGLNGSALAQTNSGLVVIDDTSGTDGTNPLRGNCEMSGSGRDRLVTCTDLRPGRGVEVTDSPAETAPVATEVTPAPAPSAEEATAPETTETAVATPTDQDADNFDDALEPEAGLDPTTADTDRDYVADGDEFALYQTDPTLADTDGDGALDGEELFGTHTNPLLWEESSETAATGEPVASSEPASDPAPAAAPVAETTTPAETTAPVAADTASSDAVAPSPAGTTENLSATSGGASSLGDGDASAVPGTLTRDGVTVSDTSLLGPDGTYRVSESSPPVINVSGETTGVSVVPAPGVTEAPVVETAAPVESADPVAAETAVATPEDQDADNMADASEVEIGLDPGDPDTDGDGVADGDESTLYGTDPFAGDSDGDGLMDGDELYVAGTDPLTGDAAGTT